MKKYYWWGWLGVLLLGTLSVPQAFAGGIPAPSFQRDRDTVFTREIVTLINTSDAANYQQPLFIYNLPGGTPDLISTGIADFSDQEVVYDSAGTY